MDELEMLEDAIARLRYFLSGGECHYQVTHRLTDRKDIERAEQVTLPHLEARRDAILLNQQAARQRLAAEL